MNTPSSTPGLELPRKLVNQILAHAQQNPEEEICGLISAKNNEATHYYPVSNVAADKTSRFEMAGPEQIAVMKTIRQQGEELLAIVHSHPDAPAVPSELDKENDAYPELYYLVVSLNTKGVLELRGFLKKNGVFEPAEVVLEHPANA